MTNRSKGGRHKLGGMDRQKLFALIFAFMMVSSMIAFAAIVI
ncbi:MAG: hypothetical protein ACOC42_00030 [Halobacteriota archaeon]